MPKKKKKKKQKQGAAPPLHERPAPRSDLWLAGALPVILLLPFLNKAFHIDDPLFIWTARHILEEPFNFYNFTTNWNRTETPIYEVMQNPPLLSYYLAPIGALGGWGEPLMHLAMLPFAVLAGLGTYFVARRFCGRPLLATLIATFTPAFLVSACQVMSDIPMVAVWLWAMIAWFRGLEREQPLYCVAGGVLIAVGALTKYFAASLTPLLLVYTLLYKRETRQYAWYLLIPVVLLFAYEFYTLRLYGVGLIRDASRYALEYRAGAQADWFGKALNGVVFTGGCLASTAFFTPWLWGRRFLIVLGAGVLAAVGLNYMYPESGVLERVYIINMEDPGQSLYSDKFADASLWQMLQWSFWFVAGLQILFLAIVDMLVRQDNKSLLLLLWISGTLFFVCFVNHYVNARVILPMGAAAAFLTVRRLEDRYPEAWPFATQWRAWPLVPAAALALVLCVVDYALAGSARHAARDITAQNDEGTIWFSGHSGFQYYMQENGARSIDWSRDVAHPGDTYVLPSNNWQPIPLGPHLVADHEVLEYWTFPWITTSHYVVYAGFYSDDAGPLPFVFSKVPKEEYLVVEVGALQEQPGAAG